MARAARKRRFSLPLLLVCVALGYVLYLEANAELSVPQPVAVATIEPGPAATLPHEPDFEMPPLDSFSETLARPLFMETRLPPEPEPESPVEEPEPEPEPVKPKTLRLELSGIVISPTERMALLKSRRSRELIRVSQGQEVEGWVVQSILPDRVVLRQGEVLEELELKDKAPTQAARRKPRQGRDERTPAAEPSRKAKSEEGARSRRARRDDDDD